MKYTTTGIDCKLRFYSFISETIPASFNLDIFSFNLENTQRQKNEDKVFLVSQLIPLKVLLKKSSIFS